MLIINVNAAAQYMIKALQDFIAPTISVGVTGAYVSILITLRRFVTAVTVTQEEQRRGCARS